MPSETDIANRALSLLGAPPLVALDDGTANARAIGVHFEVVRDSLLRSHPWGFATARAELSALSEAPDFGWAYAYALPADNLRLLTLNGMDCEEFRDAWEVEGRSLLCNASVAQITYIRRVTDTTEFDASFADAFAKALAEAVALVITGSPRDESRMEKRAQKAIDDAAFHDARESGARVESPFSNDCARRGRLTLESLKGEKGDQGERGLQGIQGEQGESGTNGTNGADGNDGWTPVLAVVSDGERRVQQVIDWTGGEGTKPATGKYVGATGFEDLIANGVDIRGDVGVTGAAGSNGTNGTDGADGEDGVAGIRFTRASNGATPSAGQFSIDNSTVSSVTSISISETSAESAGVATWLATFEAGDSIHVTGASSSAWLVIASILDESGYYTFTISSAAGTVAAVSEIHGIFLAKKGDTGATGSAGTNGTNGTNGSDGLDGDFYGLEYKFSTSTTNSDPGAGYLRFDNATLSSATRLYIDDETNGAVNVDNYIGQWTAVSDSTVRGTLIIQKKTDLTVYRIFHLTGIGSVVSGYHDLIISHQAGNGSFAADDLLMVQFLPTGDKGDTGADGVSEGIPISFDSSTTMGADPGSGEFRLNSATPSTVTALTISTTDANGVSREGEIDTIGISSNPSKAILRFQKTADPTVYLTYEVTAYYGLGSFYQLDLSYLNSAGSLTNGDLFRLAISRTGNKGDTGSAGVSGAILQSITTVSTTAVTTTNSFPLDNTIPQNSEGAEFTQLATTITPTSASSTLRITVNLTIFANALHAVVAALFRDSTADAIATTFGQIPSSSAFIPLTIVTTVSAGSTSATTFKIRYGRNSSAVVTVGCNTSGLWGGTAGCSMTVEEIAP